MVNEYSQKVKQRFWAKVKQGGSDECWEWLACKTTDGYGASWTGEKRESAHRMSWSLANGPIPDGLCVLHKCDNPGCVNPDHLFLGTQADNIADRDRKHRMFLKLGGLSPNAKLTIDQVKTIRKEYLRSGVTGVALAKEFSVTKQQISNIILEKCWKSGL